MMGLLLAFWDCIDLKGLSLFREHSEFPKFLGSVLFVRS